MYVRQVALQVGTILVCFYVDNYMQKITKNVFKSLLNALIETKILF